MSFGKDIKTAVVPVCKIRSAQGNGVMAKTRTVWRVHELKSTYWPHTMEFCLVCNREMGKAIRAVFLTFPEPVQHFLTFTPNGPGEWAERARFWQRNLMPVLPPKMYHDAMATFVSWYAHCLKLLARSNGQADEKRGRK